MTNQEKKEYLNQYLESKQRFYILAEEMNQLRSDAVRVTPIITDMPSGPHVNDKIARAIEKLEQCADALEQEARIMQHRMDEVKAAIDGLTNGTLKNLLLLRYIDDYTWEEIAVAMNYSYVHVCRLHGQALSEIML